MSNFDLVLVSPTRKQLIDALVQATAHANQGAVVLRLERDQWEELLPQLAGERQGYRQWSDSARGLIRFVSLAWWTDHQPRTHFRVRGGQRAGGAPTRVVSARQDRRPPVWHIYPDRIFQRGDGTHTQWLAACACGLCDTPEGLAWDGHCCGGCHDRRLDGELPAPLPGQEVSTTLLAHTGRVVALAFSADGHRLASSSNDRPLQLWNVGIGQPLPCPDHPSASSFALAFSPDGQLLARGDLIGGLHVADLVTGATSLVPEDPFPVTGLAFDPSGLTLAAVGVEGLQVWRRDGRVAPWYLAYAEDEPALSVAFSPDGDLLALAAFEGLRLLRVPSWSPLPVIGTLTGDRQATLGLAFSPDGRQLRTVGGRHHRTWVRGTAIQGVDSLGIYSLDQTEARQSADRPLMALEAAAFSADGAWVACLPLEGAEGQDQIFLHPTGDGRPWALGWSLDEPWTAVAFSPDGETMATGGIRGTIKLWPWRRLIEAQLPSQQG